MTKPSKTLITVATVALASSVSLSIQAAEVKAAGTDVVVEGYAVNRGGTAWATPYDGCVRTGRQSSTNLRGECGYEITSEQEVVSEKMEGVQEVAVVEKAAVTRGDQVLAQAEVELVRVSINNLQFPFNSAELTPAYKAELDNVAKLLESHRPLLRDNIEDIVVTGYTDSSGPAAYNQGLSERRAQAVADYLVSVHAVRPDHIRASGRGEEDPIASNDTDEGRRLNRRVEIETVKN